MNEHILKNEKLYQNVLNETLLRRWATAEEIAEWVYFITVINKSMTGQDIIIDNGELCKYNFIW
uniref:Tropinone reductase n=1 Tax=Siphoviridae sp. ctiOl67 TaxID=2825622 RepID=A0A8S5QJB9_9CAUD|nr:MAG TPA: tropinone reductase [Siphoviridae sp. ctiOl67]